EDAQHDAFAVDVRRGGHAQVDLMAAYGDTHAPVLGKSALRDVKPGHDLDARDDGGFLLRRKGLDIVQRAVDAQTHLEIVFGRLEVDIRGAQVDGAGDHRVDRANHRR